jgi:hypothetical protein
MSLSYFPRQRCAISRIQPATACAAASLLKETGIERFLSGTHLLAISLLDMTVIGITFS